MGRPRSLNPKRNAVVVKLSDKEMVYIKNLSEELKKGKSTIIRDLLNLLFKLDPEKLKKNYEKLKLSFR